MGWDIAQAGLPGKDLSCGKGQYHRVAAGDLALAGGSMGERLVDAGGVLVGLGVFAYSLLHVDLIFILGYLSAISFLAIYILSFDDITEMSPLEVSAGRAIVYLSYISGFAAFRILSDSPLGWSMSAVLGLLVMCFIIRSRYSFRLEADSRSLKAFILIFFLSGTLWRLLKFDLAYLSLTWTAAFAAFVLWRVVGR